LRAARPYAQIEKGAATSPAQPIDKTLPRHGATATGPQLQDRSHDLSGEARALAD
jgi:hypothetical protein